jgi:hypothetical protein
VVSGGEDGEIQVKMWRGWRRWRWWRGRKRKEDGKPPIKDVLFY